MANAKKFNAFVSKYLAYAFDFSLQEKNVLSVHLVGAVMTFACGVAYCWIHSYLTYKSRENGLNASAATYARFTIAFFVTVFFILGILFSTELDMFLGSNFYEKFYLE